MTGKTKKETQIKIMHAAEKVLKCAEKPLSARQIAIDMPYNRCVDTKRVAWIMKLSDHIVKEDAGYVYVD
jgi:hypothetical protein